MPKKLVCGFGINDADYVVAVNGKREPFYACWLGMISRVYLPAALKRSPQYSDVSVCDEWRSFMTFRAWMAAQQWQGRQLDKDIIFPGNRVYRPDRCAFVWAQANSLLSSQSHATGYAFIKTTGRYAAYCGGASTKLWAREYLGTFDTPEEARHAYLIAKAARCRNSAALEADARVVRALHARADALVAEAEATKETACAI